MGKGKKKRKVNGKSRIFLAFALLLIIVVLFLVSEIISINKNGKLNFRKASTDNNEQEQQTQIDDNIDEDIVAKFDSFVNEMLSVQELENMSSSDMINIYKNDDEVTVSISDCKKLCGSTSSKEGAIINGKAAFYSNNQFINSSKIVDENDYYYVVEVNYSYIDPNVTRDYVERTVVLKDSIYDDSSQKFNSGKIADVKIVLDLKYYLKFHSNGSKSLIQSFVNDNNGEWIYTVYYFNANYGQDNVDDTIDLVKDVVHINSQSGEVTNTETIEVRTGVRV